MTMNKFHLSIRLGLGAHGAFHVAEFALNVAEGAAGSALLTLLSGALMLSGAFIDHQHHSTPCSET
jgi:hypothetical protein